MLSLEFELKICLTCDTLGKRGLWSDEWNWVSASTSCFPLFSRAKEMFDSNVLKFGRSCYKSFCSTNSN
jgi:hypothetical protein